MIALHPHSSPLGPVEQFGLDVLLDHSRLLRYSGDADVVRLMVVEGDATITQLAADASLIGRSPGELAIRRGVLRLVGEVAGAVAEQQSEERDRHGRVPSSVNALVSAGMEREPLVSRLAVILRQAAIAVAERRPMRLLAPWPEGRRWAAAFTHDLDVMRPWPAFTALRLAELVRKGEGGRVAAVMSAALRSAAGDPVWTAVQELLATEHRNGVRSTWFVLCGTPTLSTIRAGDLTYVPESRAVRRILSAVLDGDHEIGLHGSFATCTDASRFRTQRERLGRVTGQLAAGARQHYLRMIPGRTQLAMHAAGFQYDSTFGFADRNGFRLGVADVLPVWNNAESRAMDIDEVPFVWMDRALSKYRGVEAPSEWVTDALELATKCREVEGLWAGIWHPNLVPALGFPGAPAQFERLMREIMLQCPYNAPMKSLVEWRRARRSARATAINPDGAITIAVAEHAGSPVVLEDAMGRAVDQRMTHPE